jgi:hypothetical protein
MFLKDFPEFGVEDGFHGAKNDKKERIVGVYLTYSPDHPE